MLVQAPPGACGSQPHILFITASGSLYRFYYFLLGYSIKQQPDYVQSTTVAKHVADTMLSKLRVLKRSRSARFLAPILQAFDFRGMRVASPFSFFREHTVVVAFVGVVVAALTEESPLCSRIFPRRHLIDSREFQDIR